MRTAASDLGPGTYTAMTPIAADALGLAVPRVVSAFAAGRIINARTAHSQAIGGVARGLGMARLEEAVRDRRNGRVLNANLELN